MLKERVTFKDLKEEFYFGNKKAIVLTGITLSLLGFCQIRAYQLGDITVIAPLCSLSVILNVILGYIFLKEKNNLLKKIIAAILITVSIILINV